MMNLHRTVALSATLVLAATLAFAQARTVQIRLKSQDKHYKSKFMKNYGVRLVRQRSTSPCIQGRSWGFTSNKVWVDRGCEADFSVVTRRPGGRPPGRWPHHGRH